MLPRRVWDFIRSLGAEGGVFAEIRGWRFDYVSPRYRYRPSPSEVAGICPVHRDVFLRRVMRIKPKRSKEAVYGAIVHEFFLEPFRLVDRGVSDLEALSRAMWRLGKRLGVRIDGFLQRVYTVGAGLALQSIIDADIPVRVEPQIPGAAVGLSDIVRPDLLVGFLPVEVTTASSSTRYGEGKELQLAGYALALEAWTGLPVDYGVALYIRRRDSGEPWLEWRVVVIDDGLRRRFLRARDEVAMIVDNSVDPGPAGENCPPWCPFRGAPGCPPAEA
ncbi:type I-A CRISPR-associated protein Cas4/Csa1 [Pyrofollis japonicus]|uniref:type I-A CRISPR-associated protein Cas4/Csa1 n=1 Tax=Pyrofollis japonicus TaxID=3060460 RepID=UPI00295B8485|nr:type I-A CRISPR-associated protein Cas4/Csa1 [Pyrofollis japonicus]BEP17275.1 type I-A CRISPR-associated protein Cas4/Csa1 [Pyrofollis japonicus]